MAGYLFILLITLPVGYFLYRILDQLFKARYRKRLEEDFLAVWSGRAYEKRSAWYRVRRMVLLRRHDPDEVHYIDRKIAMIPPEEILSIIRVDRSGQLTAPLAHELQTPETGYSA
ncbi:MAG: hypothetical protein WDZ29_04465 [Balneolaceae bacterium]